MKVCCKQLIDEMPDEGMAEVLEFLKDALEFYSHKFEPPVQPTAQRLTGVFTSVVERPPLIIDEDYF